MRIWSFNCSTPLNGPNVTGPNGSNCDSETSHFAGGLWRSTKVYLWFHSPFFHNVSLREKCDMTPDPLPGRFSLFWTEIHPLSKFRGNQLNSFCLTLLTNQPTNKRTQYSKIPKHVLFLVSLDTGDIFHSRLYNIFTTIIFCHYIFSQSKLRYWFFYLFAKSCPCWRSDCRLISLQNPDRGLTCDSKTFSYSANSKYTIDLNLAKF